MSTLKDFITNVFGGEKTSPDMEIIQQIGKQTGKKLKPVPLEEIWSENGYALDQKTGQVKGLSLEGRKIKDISFLRDLSGLTHLSLRGNQVTDRHLTPLSALTKLIRLDLDNNQLTDLTPLSALTNLTVLVLNGNQLTDLTPLSALTNLTGLYLSNNQVTDLTPLRALTNLTELGLNDNQLTDVTPLSALTKLTELVLSNNQLTDLTPLKELKHLKTLDVRNNRLQHLPPDVTSWWPGMEIKLEEYFLSEGLNLYGNLLTDPPVEIVKQGKAAIENYFAEIQQAYVLFLESKLLLVGSGDVGKTSLMKKLKDNTFVVTPGVEDTTRGIDIQTWQLSCSFPDGPSRDVNIHFWDFGGQDILHATHQFFLTKRSLYLFVWDRAKKKKPAASITGSMPSNSSAPAAPSSW